MSISELKKYLKDNNITYNQLSEMTGISLTTLKYIFSGKTTNPRLDTMQAIEKALHLTPDNPTIPLIFYDKLSDVGNLSKEAQNDIIKFIDYIKAREKTD